MKQSVIKKADVVLIAALLAAVVVWLVWPRPDGCIAVIEQDGEELQRIDLSSLVEEKEIDLGGSYEVRLLAGPGYIEFLSSLCPDQVCVRTGRLTKAGEAAVCLPAKISVRLEGETVGYDAYTG